LLKRARQQVQVVALVEIGVPIHGMNEAVAVARASVQDEMEIRRQLLLVDLHLFVLL